MREKETPNFFLIKYEKANERTKRNLFLNSPLIIFEHFGPFFGPLYIVPFSYLILYLSEPFQFIVIIFF